MNPREQPDQIDLKLDELLRSSPLEASPHFTKNLLERLHDVERRQGGIDATLSALLARQPVQASPDFAKNTLQRIRAEKVREERVKVISFPFLACWFSAAAAIFVIGFFGVQFLLPPKSVPTEEYPVAKSIPVTPYEIQVVEESEEVEEIIAEVREAPHIPIMLKVLEETEVLPDLQMAELFLLAESMTDAEVLLDGEVFDTLTFIATQ